MLTHGNGPQVGFILRRSELASNEVSPVPLDYAVGDTQGAIGYMFQKALHNELARRGINKPVIAPVTQTRVSPHDDAFASPSKPIGAFLDEATAQQRQQQLGWTLMEDAGRGWRRTVPLLHHWKLLSTTPSLTVRRGYLVIACGGGGIPVVRDGQQLKGVEAVIDKDLASALLASQLGADLLVIPTGVEKWRLTLVHHNNSGSTLSALPKRKRCCGKVSLVSAVCNPKWKPLLISSMPASNKANRPAA